MKFSGWEKCVHVCLVVCLSSSSALAASASSNEVMVLAEEYVDARLSYDPTLAYLTGLETSDHHRLPDRATRALRALERKEDAFLARLDRIPRSSVSFEDRATYAVLRELLESRRDLRVCKSEYWEPSHFLGWQTYLPLIAEQQPIGTAPLRAEALARWRSLPKYLDVELENLRAGLRAGYSVPKPVVRRVVQQLDPMLAAAPEKSPFYSPAKRDTDAAFKAELRKSIEQRVNPAIRKYRNFLANDYLPQARDTLSLASLPEGARCYRAQLRAYTTLTRTPAEVYALGEKTVAANAATVVEIGAKLYGTRDLESIIRSNRDADGNHFASADQYLEYSNELLQRAVELLQPMFLRLPDQRVIIEPMPTYEDDSGVSAYYNAQPDVTKPGKYMMPLRRWQSETRGNAEITLVHETYPGHHLQIAIAHEQPQRSRLAKLAEIGAYLEGWARYAENLAEEAGTYRTDYARISRRIWPARGMVVDPGIHAFDWTRERAVAYLKSTGRFDDNEADAVVDRIATMPGQLTAYDTGGLELFALRKEAQEALGATFDIRRFHQSVLEAGVVPLQELRDHVHMWIAAEKDKDVHSRTGDIPAFIDPVGDGNLH